jgi:hypothetical protein
MKTGAMLRKFKRIISLLFLLFCFSRQSWAQPADEALPEVDSLPATVQCQMLSSLFSERSEIGDKVEVKLAEPINLSNERVFVPVGAIISGQVSEVQEAGRGLKRGKVKVAFERIYFPNGFSLETDAYLMGNQKTLIENKDIEGKSSWSQRFLQAGKVGAGALFGGPIGAGIAAGTLVFDKGGKVRIKEGETVSVRIIKLSPATDLDVKGKIAQPDTYLPAIPGAVD